MEEYPFSTVSGHVQFDLAKFSIFGKMKKIRAEAMHVYYFVAAYIQSVPFTIIRVDIIKSPRTVVSPQSAQRLDLSEICVGVLTLAAAPVFDLSEIATHVHSEDTKIVSQLIALTVAANHHHLCER
jgi:hypothetical protein